MDRTVSVVGSGSVWVAPDCARLSCGVQVAGVNGQDALRRSNSAIEAILAALGEAGVAAAAVRTGGPNLYPSEAGYTGSNEVTVDVDDVGAVGRVIDAVAEAAGPNLTMHGVTFSVSNPSAHLPAARAAAFESARQIATELAEAAGSALGEVLAVSETPGAWSPYPGPVALATKSTPVAPGSQELRAEVSVTYRLLDR